MTDTRERGRTVCRRVADRIAEVTPAGLGTWKPAWDLDLVRDPSDHFLDALDAWLAEDEPDTRKDLQAAAEALVRAWREVGRQFRRDPEAGPPAGARTMRNHHDQGGTMSNEASMTAAGPEPLYGVSYKIPEFSGHTGVPMTLYREEGEPPFDVAGYLTPEQRREGKRSYEWRGVYESFTKAEAEALVEYFRENWPAEDFSIYVAIEGSVPDNTWPFAALPVGGGADFYMFTKHDDIQLPVPVWGYFDLRHAESGPYVEEEWIPDFIVTPDGVEKPDPLDLPY